ncbi:MAG TPA: alpha/beta hydrolase-fold protein [Acidimicrobiales bacterium]|nr:alpha/beta hydrolase-fold protein [Acidimicrobiales bacterium]
MLLAPEEGSPVVGASAATFRLADPHRRLRAARVLDEIGLRGPLDMAYGSGEWRLRLPRPPVDRMEYLYEIEDRHGKRTTITDPANPRRAAGAFGEKSEARFPGYVPPAWLDWPQVGHAVVPFEPRATVLGRPLTGSIWQPESLSYREGAPLLVVHDGPEYATLGSFTNYLGAAIGAGALPRLRAALLDPGDRNRWYAANSDYASALAATISSVVPATVRIAVGLSLGGVAVLHAHRVFPELFDAMFLQSASFFTPALDPQERHFSGFEEVTRFVAGLHAAGADERPVPAVLTCGAVEENLANNRSMTATLRRLGYPAELVEVRDAHNYTAWRDALHPHLTALVSNLLANRAA